MTDKELVQTYHECESHPGCAGCQWFIESEECPMEKFTPGNLLTRLEAILAENESLRIQLNKLIRRNDELLKLWEQVPRWVSAEERLPDYDGDVLVLVSGKYKNISFVRTQMIGAYLKMAGFHPQFYSGYQFAVNRLRCLPKADVAEVRHGKWQGTADGYADGELVYDMWNCSECGFDADGAEERPDWKFCPNCGARMDGGADNR